MTPRTPGHQNSSGGPQGSGGRRGQGASRPGRPGKTGKPGKGYGASAGKGHTGKGAARGGPAGGGGRTPQPGQKGGPFRDDSRDGYDRNLGAARKPQRPNRARREQNFSEVHDPSGVRLQKLMASAGVASRRVCEDLIAEGRVEVDGKVVTETGVRVDPETSVIHVDGIRLQLDTTLRYFAFNKPRGVVSTMDDPEGRPCISDYLKKGQERLFHVGRLDTETEGLLLLTNDGELANRLTHPRYEVPKTYLVQVPGPMAKGVGAQLKEGIHLEDGFAQVDSFKLVDSTPGHVLVEVVLHSGKNRIVRRMFKEVGYPVERLVRVKFGPIALGDQKQGTVRQMGRQEMGHLMASVGL
jgi:pseudouridine synthase